MYTLQIPWKEEKVNLNNIDSHLRSEYPAFAGCSANAMLELHFTEELSAEDKADVIEYWENLDGSDYKSTEEIQAEVDELKNAIIAAKANLVSKSWDDMSTVERKIVMNMEVTRSEMGLE